MFAPRRASVRSASRAAAAPRCASCSASARPASSTGGASATSDPPRRGAPAHRRRHQGAGARPHRGDRRPRQHLARRRIRAGARAGSIARAAADVTLVPGNHDVYVRAPRNIRSCIGAITCAATTAATAFPFVRRRGPLALIGLSSAVPTPPFLATGRLGDAQMQKLAAALDRSAARGFRVVLIHHPPMSKPLDISSGWSMARRCAPRWRGTAPSSSSTATTTSMR